MLSGRGTTYAESGEYPLEAGDTILMPAGEKHVTRNTGSEPLLLLCFFPVADVAKATEEPPSPEAREQSMSVEILCLRPRADFERAEACRRPRSTLCIAPRVMPTCPR